MLNYSIYMYLGRDFIAYDRHAIYTKITIITSCVEPHALQCMTMTVIPGRNIRFYLALIFLLFFLARDLSNCAPLFLTLTAPITTAADDKFCEILLICEKIRYDISCQQTILM